MYKYFNIVADFNIVANCISYLENALNRETTMKRTSNWQRETPVSRSSDFLL